MSWFAHGLLRVHKQQKPGFAQWAACAATGQMQISNGFTPIFAPVTGAADRFLSNMCVFDGAYMGHRCRGFFFCFCRGPCFVKLFFLGWRAIARHFIGGESVVFVPITSFFVKKKL